MKESDKTHSEFLQSLEEEDKVKGKNSKKEKASSEYGSSDSEEEVNEEQRTETDRTSRSLESEKSHREFLEELDGEDAGGFDQVKEDPVKRKKKETPSAPSPSGLAGGTFESGLGGSAQSIDGLIEILEKGKGPEDLAVDSSSQPKPATEEDFGVEDPAREGLTEQQQEMLGPSMDISRQVEAAKEMKNWSDEEAMLDRPSFNYSLGAKKDAVEPYARMEEQIRDNFDAEMDARTYRLKSFADRVNSVTKAAENDEQNVGEFIDSRKEGMVDELLDPVVQVPTSGGAGYLPNEEKETEADIMKKEFRKLQEIKDLEDNREKMISKMGEEGYMERLKKKKKELGDIREERYSTINDELDRLKKQKTQVSDEEERARINQRISTLESHKEQVFSDDPKKAFSRVADKASSSSDAIHAYDMVPKDLPPKERFDTWYYTLYQKNRDLGDKLGLLNEEGEFRNMPADVSFRSMLGEDDTFGGYLGLNEAEQRFLENERILRDLAPIYFTNSSDVGMKEGFWESFGSSLQQTVGGEASSLANPQEKRTAQNVNAQLKEMGVEGTNPDAIEAISRRSQPSYMLGDQFSITDPTSWDNINPEKTGQTMGMLSGVIGQYAVGSAVGTGILSGAGRLARISNTVKKAYDRGKKSGDDLIRAFTSRKGKSNTIAKHLKASSREGFNFEVTGEIFGHKEDEFNAVSGFLGHALGRGILAAGDNKATRKVMRRMTEIFGDETPRAAKLFASKYKDLFRKLGQKGRKVANLEGKMARNSIFAEGEIASGNIRKAFKKWGGYPVGVTGRGLGETGEETVQEMTQIWRDTEAGQSFWQHAREKFGKVNENGEKELDLRRAEEFLMTSFAMGIGFGLASPIHYFNENKEEVFNSASDKNSRVMQEMANDIVKGTAEGMVEVDKQGRMKFGSEIVGEDEVQQEAPQYIVNGQEMSREEFVQRAETKEFKDQVINGNTEVVIKNDPELMQWAQKEFGNDKVQEEPTTAPEDTDVEAQQEAEGDVEQESEQQQEEEAEEEVIPQTVGEMQGKTVETEDDAGTISIDDEGNVTMESEEGATVAMGKAENIDPSQFRIIEEEQQGAQEAQQQAEEQQETEQKTQQQADQQTQQQTEEQVEEQTEQEAGEVDQVIEEAVQGDQSKDMEVQQRMLEDADFKDTHRKVKDRLEQLNPDAATQYTESEEVSSTQAASEVESMLKDARGEQDIQQRAFEDEVRRDAIESQQETDAGTTVSEGEVQQEVEGEMNVEAQEQAEQTQEQPADTQQEETLEEFPQEGPIELTEDQQQSVDESLQGLSEEEVSNIEGALQDLQRDPTNDEALEDVETLVDQTNMSEEAKDEVKAVARDVRNVTPTVEQQAVQEDDADAMSRKVHEDINAIRDRESTPKETGIGKKLNRLRSMDEEAYQEAMENYRPVIEEYQAETRQAEREQERQAVQAEEQTGGAAEESSENITRSYIDALENSSKQTAPDQLVDFEEVTGDHQDGNITDEQYNRVREAYNAKKERFNEFREQSGDVSGKVREDHKRKPFMSAEVSEYSATFIDHVLEKLRNTFKTDIPVVREFKDVRYNYERKVGRKVSDEEVPAAFMHKVDGELAVFVNPMKAGPDSVIEEFAHIWIEAVEQHNPELIAEGKNLVMEHAQDKYQEVLQDPAYSDLNVDEAQKEALAKLIAEQGAKIETQSNWKNFMDRILDFIKRALGIGRRIKMRGEGIKDDAKGVTLKNYTRKIARELLDKTPITELSAEQLRNIEEGKFEGYFSFDEGIAADKQYINDKFNNLWNSKLSQTFGAGKRNMEIIRKATNKIKAEQMRAREFIFPKYKEALKTYTKKLKDQGLTEDQRQAELERTAKQVNDALQGNEESFKDMPSEFRQPVKEMRSMIDRMSQELLDNAEFLSDHVRAVITQNMGVYVHRTYRKHEPGSGWTLDKALGQLTQEQKQDLQKHIEKEYGSNSIDFVNLKKTGDGDVQISFTNKRGVESKVLDDPQGYIDVLRDESLISDSDHQAIKRSIKNGEEGTFELEYRISGQQNIVPFNMSAGDVKQIMRTIAETDEEMSQIASNGYVRAAGLGKSEKGSLKKRNDIDEKLRLLMGEVKEPGENFIKTISEISNMAYKAEMEERIMAGENRTLFSRNPTSTHTESIKESESQRLANMFGGNTVYTTPEMKMALVTDPRKTSDAGSLYSSIQAMSAVTKANLTIFKPDSQARNFIGAYLMLFNSGVFGVTKMNDAVKASTAHFSASQDAATAAVPPLAVAKLAGEQFSDMSKDEAREFFLKMVRLGLADESVQGGAIDDLAGVFTESKNKGVQWGKASMDFASRIYQSSDLIPKAVKFMVERKRYARAMYNKEFDQLNEDQANEVEEFTTRRVREELPTYTDATQFERQISKNIFIAPFVTFTSRRLRNNGMILKHIAEDVSNARRATTTESRNEWLKDAGKKSAGFLSMQSLMFKGIGMAMSALYGWSDEEDEAFSRFLPSYSQNSGKFYTTDDKRNPTYYDLSFHFPDAYPHRVVRAWNRGQYFSEKDKGFVEELYDPFVGKEVFASHMIDFFRNQDQYGNELTKKDPDFQTVEHWAERTMHLGKPLVPGLAKNAREIVYAWRGDKTHYGQDYSFWNSFNRMVTGLNEKDRDTRKLVVNRIAADYNQMEEMRREYKKEAKKTQKSTFKDEGTLKEAHEDMSYAAQKFYKEVHRSLNAAEELDIYDKKAILDDAGVPNYMKRNILYEGGYYPGFDERSGDWKNSPNRSYGPPSGQ